MRYMSEDDFQTNILKIDIQSETDPSTYWYKLKHKTINVNVFKLYIKFCRDKCLLRINLRVN